jgi:hypothetical protein
VVFSIVAILALLASCEPEDDLPLPFRIGETANGVCIPGEQRQCA